MKFLRPTFAEINLKNLEYNHDSVRSRLKPSVRILSVVKADGYGHGAVPVSRVFENKGVHCLGVALPEEGIALRQAGIKIPILIMGSIYPLENFRVCFRYRLTPTVASLVSARALSQMSRRLGRSIQIHIKLDTGMGRVGINANHAFSVVKRISELPGLRIEGIYSHLAQADSISPFTRSQILRFKSVTAALRRSGVKIPLAHIANSVALLNLPESHMEMVRPGISLYGLLPYRGAEKKLSLKPVMTFKTAIVFLKKIKKGTSISYGRTWRAARESVIATLPVGYADGYNRLLSNRGEVLIRGRRFPVVGRVCMDMIMVDVTDLDAPGLGEEAVLWGEQSGESISCEEVAGKISTINYELVSNLNKRVPRVYIR